MLTNNSLLRSVCLALAAVCLAPTAGLTQENTVVTLDPIDGFTEPYKVVHIASPENGVLATLDIKEGDRVSNGQVLGALNSDVHAAMLKVAEAGMAARGRLESAEAELALRRTRLEKLRILAERGHARHEEVNRAEADLEIAEGNTLSVREDLDAKRLEYERIRLQLERRSVRATLDGVVTEVFKQPGEYVGPGDPVIAEIVQLNPLAAVFMMTRQEAAGLAPGQPVTVKMADTFATTSGTVEYVAPTTDAESGLLRVKVRVDNSDGSVHSGEACSLHRD